MTTAEVRIKALEIARQGFVGCYSAAQLVRYAREIEAYIYELPPDADQVITWGTVSTAATLTR